MIFEEFDAQNPGKLAVLSETISISSDNIVLIRKDMDPAMAAAIKTALLGMKDTEEGQAILRGTKTVSFGEFLQEGTADWDKTREQYFMIQD
jgi:ABC-type phosphate/phosphonate transport system substrate-binding protein